MENVWEELNSIVMTKNNSHSNIIKYYDAFLYENDEGTEQNLIVVMEKGEYDLE